MTNKLTLTDQQKTKFQYDGFIILNIGLDEELLDKAISDMSSLHKQQPDKNPYTKGQRVQDGWKHSKAVHDLATRPEILEHLRTLYGRKALPFQTLNFPFGSQQKIHSDTLHFNSMPSGYMAGVWIALEDVDRNNGPVVYYPGSHKLPEYNMQDAGLEAGRENYKKYELFIEKKILESESEPFYAEMRKGDVLIWHANLIHGGSKRLDLKRTRHSQVTHYFFEECKYYTPMNSKPNQISWRKPTWIPTAKKGLIPKIKNWLNT